MDNQELVNSIRKIFAKVVSQDRANLILILNKNGFPTSSATSNDDLILDSLKALQLSKNFENSASNEFNSNLEANSEDDSDNDPSANNNALFLLSMPGNERYSFEIKFKENYIYLINGNDEYKSKNEITQPKTNEFHLFFEGSVYSIVSKHSTSFYLIRNQNECLIDLTRACNF